MKNKYALEVINGCCFEHNMGDILKRFSTRQAAIRYAKTIEKMTIKQTEQFDLDHFFITSLRVIDTSLYPPDICYQADMNEIIPDLEDDDIPTWSIYEASTQEGATK